MRQSQKFKQFFFAQKLIFTTRQADLTLITLYGVHVKNVPTVTIKLLQQKVK